jgi:hypothetical protein
MKTRRVITLTVLLSFLVLSLSGLLMFVSPQGRVAYWSRWTLVGLTKEQLTAIHTTVMVLFLAAAIWHVVLNWKPIVGYLRNRSKQVRVLTPEFAVALVLTGLFVVGPLAGFFPFRQYLDAGEKLKSSWEAESGSPPWGHAEESTLARFCQRMEDLERSENQRLIAIDCDAAVQALRDRGLAVESTNQRIVDIAEANGTTPQDISAIVLGVARPMTPEEAAARIQAAAATGTEARFKRPASRLGQLTLASYAEQYGYDLAEIQSILAAAGYQVDPEARLRDEAARLGTDPEGIFEVLNGKGGSAES